jgi:hypothetical protein
MLHRLHAAAALRLHELTRPERRSLGEGPVPYIIMVAIIAGVAFTIAGLLSGIADGWLGSVPKK